MSIESVDAAVARVKASASRPKDRTPKVKDYLKGKANPNSVEGKALLHRRAEFVTKLRELKIWPG